MLKPIILDVECIVCNKTLHKINHDPGEVSSRMSRIGNRRSRTPNWSLDEKQYLLELIREYKEVVVTKSNNGPNHSEEKDVAWNEILSKLAGKFGSKFAGFSIKKVKTQWQNMKRIAREEIQCNGSNVDKYTRQSLDVCNILKLINDGVVNKEHENLNESLMAADIEIKTECVDDDMGEQSAGYTDGKYSFMNNEEERSDEVDIIEPFEPSAMEVVADTSVSNRQEDDDLEDNLGNNKNIETMTEPVHADNITNIISIGKELKELLSASATEKQLKLESLNDERQVFRAMRETAELNKIIAEQKLKQVLWMNKQEMFSSEEEASTIKLL